MSRSGRPRPGPEGSGKGDDFYSQIANLAGDLDSSGTDGSGGELNSSPVNVDIDSLEANLFSSLKKETTTRSRRDNSGVTSSSSTKKESSFEKKSKGFDMGELSKLLGTEDIMKDLTSTKSKKPRGSSDLSKAEPLKKSDPQIKKEADELLDLLSATDFGGSDGKPAKTKVTLYTTKSHNNDETTSSNIDKPITSVADDASSIVKKSDSEQNEGAGSTKDAFKPTAREKKPLKTAATISFDSDDDDGDDLLAGLGLDDDNDGKRGKQISRAGSRGLSDHILAAISGDNKPIQAKGGSKKKTVRFTEDALNLEVSTPDSVLDDSLTVKQPQFENGGSGAAKSIENKELELPTFPWQKKPQQPLPSLSNTKSTEEGGHAKVEQTESEKLEPPQFPWQKTQKEQPKRKSSLETRGLTLDAPIGKPMDQIEALSKTEGPVLSSPEDLLGLGDPFAKTTHRTRSQPELQKKASSSPEVPLELEDPNLKRSRRQTQSQTELSKQPPERALNLNDPFSKTRRKPLQSQTEPSKELSASPLDMGDPFAKTSSKPTTKSQPIVQNQSPEAMLQFDDPFAKTKHRPSQLQANQHKQTSPALSSAEPPAEIGRKSAAIKSESPRPVSGVLSVTGGNFAEKEGATIGSESLGVRQEDLLRTLKRAEEAESALEKERSEHAQCKRSLLDTENKLHLTKSEMEKWKLEAQAYKSNMSETESARQSVQEELRTKVKDTTLALQKVEMNHNHTQELLESTKKRHEEEIDSLKQSHCLRVNNLEESLSRMENRWKDELKAEANRWQQKLEQAEKEKFEAVQSLQTKLNSLEMAKINDMERAKSLHLSSIETMKTDHEAEKEQLVRRHLDEVKAIKDAHSHSRTLTELNSKVEASSQMVSQLQAKLAEEHGKVLEERAQRNRVQESQLKVMEERLVQQQIENEAERSRLQGLLAKMEAHISQQNRTLEQDRWTLQQDQARLKAQQIAFREEQIQGRKRLEEDREQFQQVREQFLVEQQDILTKCYQEQRKIALDKAETSFRRKKAEDYEMSSKHLSQQTVADRNMSISHLNEELVQVEIEKKRLVKLEEDLKVERRLVDAEKERLQKFADEVCSRSREVDTMCKDATEMQKKGEKELKEAQEIKKECLSQQEHLQSELAHLRKKELLISKEHLELIDQRKQLEELMQKSSIRTDRVCPFEAAATAASGISAFTPIPVARNSPTVPQLDSEPFAHPAMQASQPLSVYSSLTIPPTSPRPPPPTNSSFPLMQSSPLHQHVPKFSEVHSSRPRSRGPSPVKPNSIQAYLQQIENNISSRQLDAHARKDYEELEKQQAFLASLSSSRINL